MKIPNEIDNKMYEAHQRIWVGGMIIKKRFQDYKDLVQDLDNLGYDTIEYHKIIRIIHRGIEEKVEGSL